jgi:amino acid transporter
MPLASLIATIYLTVSGGVYGLEDSIRIAGGLPTIMMCMVIPLSLSLPSALMAAELTALMPVEGGFYFWVKEAFGPFAGFAEAYLTVLYTIFDLAIYPLLFSAYLSFLIPVSVPTSLLLAVSLIWLSGLMNLAGIRLAGSASLIMTVVLFVPVVVLIAIGAPLLFHWRPPVASRHAAGLLGTIGEALSVVIWNFCGWENMSVVAGEVKDASRNYPRALAVSLPMVVLGYLLPLLVMLSGATDTAQWRLGWFSREAGRIGGRVVGAGFSIGGAVSALAVFDAELLWVSRLPFVLAREHYLPRSLAQLWAATATPARAIIVCCAVFTLLLPLGFVTLVVMNVFFYMAGLALEMGALIKLRKKYAKRDRLFTIGGGRAALFTVVALPMLTWLATFGGAISDAAHRTSFLVALGLALGALPLYQICRLVYGREAQFL